MKCVHSGKYQTQAKEGPKKRVFSTLRRECKARIYAKLKDNKQPEGMCYIDKVHNIHNHSPLTEEEYKTAPQVNQLSTEAKAEAL